MSNLDVAAAGEISGDHSTMHCANLNTVTMVGKVRGEPRIYRNSLGSPISKVLIIIVVTTFSSGLSGKTELRKEAHHVWCFESVATFCDESVRADDYVRVQGALRRSKRDFYVLAGSVSVLGSIAEGTVNQ